MTTPTPGQNSNRLTVPQRVSAVAILVTILAAFLPWVSLFGISKLGIEGDGEITLVLALAGAVLLALTSGLIGKPRPGKAWQVVLLVLAVLVALVGLLDMNGVAAMGLDPTLFAGVAWIVGAAWQLSLSKSVPSDAGSGTEPDFEVGFARCTPPKDCHRAPQRPARESGSGLACVEATRRRRASGRAGAQPAGRSGHEERVHVYDSSSDPSAL